MSLNIVFVDNPFHQMTRSSEFVVRLLIEAGAHVEVIYWQPSDGLDALRQPLKTADVAVLWQLEILAPVCNALGLPAVAVPMFDAVANRSKDYWTLVSSASIVSFSLALHLRLSGLGLESRYHQYFPEPADRPRSFEDGLRGFLWERRPREALDWPTVNHFFGEQLAALHIHRAPDPGYRPSDPRRHRGDVAYDLTVSKWRRDSSAYREALERSNVYFAPRRTEGIGLSFLEAMSQGSCVVSFDTATHNEYLADGLTGILVPEQLDGWDAAGTLGRAAEIAEEGWHVARAGFRRWAEVGSASLVHQILGASLLKPAMNLDNEAMERLIGSFDEPALFDTLLAEVVGSSRPRGLGGHHLPNSGAAEDTTFLPVIGIEGGRYADGAVNVEVGATVRFSLNRAELARDTCIIVRLAAERGQPSCLLGVGTGRPVRRTIDTQQSFLVIGAGRDGFAPLLSVSADVGAIQVLDVISTTADRLPRQLASELDLGDLDRNYSGAIRDVLLDWLIEEGIDPYIDSPGQVNEMLVLFRKWVLQSHLEGSSLNFQVLASIAIDSWREAAPGNDGPLAAIPLSEVYFATTAFRRLRDPDFAAAYPADGWHCVSWYYLHGIAEHRLGQLLGDSERRFLFEQDDVGSSSPVSRLVSLWRSGGKTSKDIHELQSLITQHPGLRVLL